MSEEFCLQHSEAGRGSFTVRFSDKNEITDSEHFIASLASVWEKHQKDIFDKERAKMLLLTENPEIVSKAQEAQKYLNTVLVEKLKFIGSTFFPEP